MKERFFKYAPIILFAISTAIWLTAYLLHNIITLGSCIVSQIVILICCGISMKRLHQQAIRDSLTGLYNKRCFHSKLSEISEDNFPISLLMIDIDNFKRINDTYGHLTGDDILKQITEIFINSIRKSDWVARLGGEEFAVVLPQTSPEEALRLAERLRNVVEGYTFGFEHNNVKMTISIGVATADTLINMNDLLKLADNALYKAKEIKNSVIAD